MLKLLIAMVLAFSPWSSVLGVDALLVNAQADVFARQVVELTNRERQAKGLSPLKPHPTLRKAAQWLADDMAKKSYFSHTDSLGREFSTRLRDFRYEDATVMAENVGMGARDPARAVANWMKSPGHRANILNPELTEIGVGYASSTTDPSRHYWVQDFGRRSESKEGKHFLPQRLIFDHLSHAVLDRRTET
jgi:uncharacterized protein YkwD